MAKPTKEYLAQLRANLATYGQRPVEIYVWTLDGRRVATANPPMDPKAKIIAHERIEA